MANKKLKIILIAFLIISVILTLTVVFSKISPIKCCACPPDGYKFYSLYKLYQEDNYALIDCFCNSERDCAPSFYIIPAELVVVNVILLIAVLFSFVRS